MKSNGPFRDGDMTLPVRIRSFFLFAFLAFALSAPAHAQSSQAPRVYLLRGLANIFSLGMDDLAAKLNARGVKATVHSYSDWQTLADAAVAESQAGGRRRPTPVVIIGHSLGADAAVYMGNKVSGNGVPVPLVVTFDPVTPTTASAAIGKVVNFYQGAGAGKPVSGPKVQNVNMASDANVGHFNIDKLAQLHDRVIAMILPPRRPAKPVAQKPKPATVAAPASPTETAAAPPASVPMSASGTSN